MTQPFAITEAICIVGGARSGKTAALIERTAAWAGSEPASPGAPEPYLFLAASPVTAADATERLARHGLADTAATPLDYACRILADPRARAITGRSPRILSRAEEAVFYEDLKTCGLKCGRLRELWAFLQCGLANLDDGDSTWIKTTEERAVLDLAESILAFQDAMLAGEAVNRAVRVLEADPELRRRYGSPVVLADDYPLMSRASQRLASLLAQDKVAVAGSDEAGLPAFEPYPNAAGMAEFEAAHELVQRVVLDGPCHLVERAWQSAPDLPGEMGVIARAVADELAAGTDPARIAVVGANRTWRTNMQRALASVGIPVTPLGRVTRPVPSRGITAPETEADRARVLAQLAADQADSVAWRRWLSFGDALGRSASVSELRRAGVRRNLNLVEALTALNADDLPGLPAASPFAQSLLASYREALALLEEGTPADPEMRATCTDAPHAAHDEDAPDSASGGPMMAPSAVVIAAPEDLFGRTFDVVVFGGFVNGFIPSRDMCDPGVIVGSARTRQEAAARAAIALVMSRASRRVLFTGFESCDLETAERLKLHIARIRLRSGVRTCDIHPSDYLAELDPRWAVHSRRLSYR
ncbi:hypothetical protein VJ923_02920 [Adlercreutzia sp. R25]|uniref:hypothetical protein n=1 Tax=Adlercreutzia shanghongiae TaxID=3111773 RepID=UPI002DBD1679|nr:hypothetical protein [Adlercreutzia sp. R25]MEC4272110.1 hypothetical protein [Adlercreutzia sp. R25]